MADSTRRDYRRSIEQWAIPFFRNRRLRDVRTSDVRGFVSHMEAGGCSPASIRKHMAAVKALFATAAEDGAIKSSPTPGVRLPGGTAKRKAKALTREQLGLVLAALPEQCVPFFTFLAQTGLRISEALGLTWDDLDLGAKPCVQVRRQRYKGKVTTLKTPTSVRDVPLTTGMAGTLLRLRTESYRGPDAPVWATRTGKSLDAHNLRTRVLRPVVADLGLPWVGFHTLRHTCASLLFAHGKDIKQVQMWLGHADPGFTLRTYVHLMDEGLGSAEFLDTAVASDQGRKLSEVIGSFTVGA